MNKIPKTSKRSVAKKIMIWAILITVVFSITLPTVVFYAIFWNRVAPGVSVDGLSVTGLSLVETKQLLSTYRPLPDQILIKTPEGQGVPILLSDLGGAIDYESASLNAYQVGRHKNILTSFAQLVSSSIKNKDVVLPVRLDSSKVKDLASSLNSKIGSEYQSPSVSIIEGQIVVNPGSRGVRVDSGQLEGAIVKALSDKSSEVSLPTKLEDPTIGESEILELNKRAESLKDTYIELTIDGQVVHTINFPQLVEYLAPNGELKSDKISETAMLVAKQNNKEAVEAVFAFSNGKVVEFAPPQDGYLIDQQSLSRQIAEKLKLSSSGKITINTPFTRETAKTSLSELNELGINELLGVGTSEFKGSIPSRVHNVSVGSSKISGVLIPPGEVFSFNQTVGDISALTGYKQAYVIKDGKTVLGDGGGICQVSSTLFRAAMAAGLPIVERRGHSYRVSYYEQGASVGLDATVYAPTTDFKFKNDTPGHILIQTKVDAKRMTATYEIYGTNDGRRATIGKVSLTNVSAPADDLYIDDPTLPVGTIRQQEHRAFGGRASFDYIVERGGEVINKQTFVSSYRPWQAVYLRGTRQ
jgi:vancomycin resistance protein YoaR